MRRGWLGWAMLCLVACAEPAPPPVRFVDDTFESGLARSTPTYDAAVGDVDGDGDPDIYVGNHELAAALLRNDGRKFADVIEGSGIDPRGDQHGVSWTDIDNDGRLDLFVSLGAFRGHTRKENRLYRNLDGARFERVAAPAGVEDPTGRSRATATLDFDGDGWLDLLVANHATPSRLFRNRGDGTFEDVSEATGVVEYSADTVTWSDFDADGDPDLLFMQGPRGMRLLRNEEGASFVDVTEEAGLDPWAAAGGAAFGDYDNDGILDLYLSSGWEWVPSAWSDGKGRITFTLFGEQSPRGFDFEAEGAEGTSVAAELFQRGSPVSPEWIRCGAEGRPTAPAFECGGQEAVANEAPSIEPGYALWRDPGSRRECDDCPEIYSWHLRWFGTGDWNEGGTIRGGVRPKLVGVATDTPRGGSLYRGRGDGSFERVSPPGLDPDVNGGDAAWLDLNGDGWLDLYAVDAGADGAPSRSQLFLNDHGERFVLAPADSGATPAIRAGRPASIQHADFDGDGRIDLFMTNGWGAPPFNRGPYLLLRNVSEPRHWLELALAGTTSSRPALGAWVELEACGRRQVRLHDGGRSDLSQSIVGPYFGLGDCGRVDTLRIRWPAGRTTELHDIQVDQRLSVQEPAPPDVLLVVIDTLRAQNLSLYGYDRDTSPSLIEFARDAITYDKAISPATWTVPAHGSLFTGRLPSFHGAERVAGKYVRATPLNPHIPTLAELLQEHGWNTGAFVANSTFVTPSLGLARGFETFVGHDETADRIVPQALDWLATQRRPTFLFLNILDPHEPYEPRKPYDERFPGRDAQYGNKITDLYYDHVKLTKPIVEHFRALYDGEVAATDEVLGRLFDRLREMGRYDESLIIVTSDHGEMLGEHGLAGHGISINQEIVHVPLIVKRPGNLGAGTRVEKRVSTMGAFAEILAAAEVPAPAGTQAVPFDRPQRVWVEDISFLGERVTVAFDGDDKMVYVVDEDTGKQRAGLYDLAEDPGENHPIDPMTRRDLGMAMLHHHDEPRPTHDVAPPVIDPERERKLRELGYVTGDVDSPPE